MRLELAQRMVPINSWTSDMAAGFQEGESQMAKAHRSSGSWEAQAQKLGRVMSAIFYWFKEVIGQARFLGRLQ